jgi:hemoglobin/transferrin/lactoferrin receptor protein
MHRNTLAALGILLLLTSIAAADEPAAPPAPASRPADEAGATGGSWAGETIVTANRGEAKLLEAPYAADRVTVADFGSNRLYRTSTAPLSEVPGVMGQRTANGQSSPYLRGMTGFRTLMMLDGIRLNNSVFREGPNQYWGLIDPLIIDRMEVVKGPSSVLYGSDAVGGTVNVLLRRPETGGEGFDWYRQAYYRGSTATHENTYRGEVNASDGTGFGLLVGGTYQNFGDVDGGQFVGRMPNTGYDVCSGDLKLELHPARDATLTLAHYSLYQNDAWRTHKTRFAVPWKGTTAGNEEERILDQLAELTYLRLHVKNLDSFIDEMTTFLSWRHDEERQRRVRNDWRLDLEGFDVDTYGGGVQFLSRTGIGEWTYGVEWYHDEVDSFARKYAADGSFAGNQIQGPVGDDARYDLLGLYVQDKLPFGDAADLTLGARYTYAAAIAGRVQDPITGERIGVEDDWNALVGSARVSVYPDARRHWNLFAGVSEGFRAPNLSDLTRLDEARSSEIETPSPGLSPEYYLTYEAGVKAKYDSFSAQAAYFYTDIHDMIVRAPTGMILEGNREVTKRNAGDGYVHGIELEAKHRFHPQWTASAGFACMAGQVAQFPTSDPVSRPEPISRLMPATGRLALRWDHPDKKVWVEGGCAAAARAVGLSTSDTLDTQRIPPDGTPSYVTFDLHAGWNVNKNLSLWAGIENISNRDYRVHGSGLNEPGIDFRFGAKVRF